MDREKREEVRRAVGLRRRPPGPGGRWVVGARGRFEETWPEDSPPCEIWVDLDRLGPSGASWLASTYVGSLASSWADRPIAMVVSASDGARLDEAAWRGVEGIRRAARSWRLVLRTVGDGAASMAVIDRVLSGQFDEIQLTTGGAPESALTDVGAAGLRGRVLSAIKQLVELRNARGQARPLVVWLHENARGVEPEVETARVAGRIARQIGVDRFGIVWSSHHYQSA